MRKRITRTVNAAIALCLLYAGISLAEGTVEERQTAVKLYRGSSVIASSDPKSSIYVVGFTPAACEQLREARWQEDAATRTSGSATYKCQVEERVIISFQPAPPPTCGDKPADLQESRTCPADTVGTWLQDRVYTLQPYPDCWVLGEWTPAVPPAGMCAPVAPVTLPAPSSIRAEGISTSAIRVTVAAVTGAGAYSLERCIGATCTSFSQFLCVQGLTGTHSSLPAGLTARYRARASRDTTCGTAAGNLGEYSAIVSGTTLVATAVNCAVSAWSAWTPGAWSTCTNSSQSRTETRTRTVTTPAANGGTACPALSETRTVTQTCGPTPQLGSASLSWSAPTTNTDGTSLTNLAGYRISYGVSATALVQTVQIANSGATSYTFGSLSPGTYYFAVRAYTSNGTESNSSNVISKVIQ